MSVFLLVCCELFRAWLRKDACARYAWQGSKAEHKAMDLKKSCLDRLLQISLDLA